GIEKGLGGSGESADGAAEDVYGPRGDPGDVGEVVEESHGGLEPLGGLAGFGDGLGPILECFGSAGDGPGLAGQGRQDLVGEVAQAAQERPDGGGDVVKDAFEGGEDGGDGVGGGGLGQEFADGGADTAERGGGLGHAAPDRSAEVRGHVGDDAVELGEQGLLDVDSQIGEVVAE